jgi:phosphoglycerate kinase
VSFLINNKNKIVILSHFGRPEGKTNEKLSLKNLLRYMEDIFKIKIKFFPVLEFERCRKDIDSSPFPSVFLFENLRFLPQEENNDPDFSCNLASLGDVYCNDAFSVSHRAHASTQGITNYLPSFAGFLVQRELSALSLALDRPLKPVSAIVGGSKISTKLAILNHLADKVDFLIVGGAMANTFLKAQGYDVGKSLIEEKMIKIAKKILTDLKSKKCKLVLPVDAVCANSLHEGDSAETFKIDSCPSNKMILDIGPASQENIIRVINKSKTLIWNGPLGAFEFSPFDRATNELAKYVAKSTSEKKITSVAGGGDTVSALKASFSVTKFSYVSTAGGAFLEWLEGKKLPGVESLK